SSLALDELIGNLKVHEVVMEKDSKIYKGKKERIKSIALKAKKESSDNETSTSGSDDEEYAMVIRNFKKFFRRKDAVIQIISLAIVQNHLTTKIKRPSLEVLGEIAKMTLKTKLMMKLVSWLNRQMRYLLVKEILELNEKIKKLERSKEIEIACKSCEELTSENAKLKETQVKFDKSTNSLREMLNNQKSPSCKIGLGFDSSKVSTSGTKTMSFVGSSTEKAMDGSTLPRPVCLEPDEWIKDSGCSRHMTGNKSLFSTYKAYDEVKVEESLNVTFDESPPPTKLSSLVDDDVGEEEAIKKNTKIVNNNNKEDESIEVDEIINIQESKNHPLDQVI
ncbi:hypothetical protein Tco_0091148, partial [Tanacetum coccineum]